MNRWIVVVFCLTSFCASVALASPQFGEDPDAVGSGTKQESTPASSSNSFFGSDTKSNVETAPGSGSKNDPIPQSSKPESLSPGSSTNNDSTSRSKPDAPQIVPFERKFWRYLSANNYKNWAPVPGQSGDFKSGQRPHGALVKMYLNRTAVGNSATIPNGSVIVQENFGPGRSLQSITVMYKSDGYHPEAGDWFWAKYNPNGTVVSGGDEMSKLAGRTTSCIECHKGANGNDFVFFND